MTGFPIIINIIIIIGSYLIIVCYHGNVLFLWQLAQVAG